jgi:N-ethylmaleimide reductase
MYYQLAYSTPEDSAREDEMTRDLLSRFELGPLSLPNRMVMAPMTRSRAGTERVPTVLTAAYYAQRASAGLIVTEATQVSPQGIGYLGTPGIHTQAQEHAWRGVTDAVHAAGGRIALQLWHVGRISHPSFQPGGALPVAPSAVRPEGKVTTPEGPQPFVTPRALERGEIPEIVDQFAEGARRALRAGFDAVEIHGANGYLIDQFLRDGTNRRTDGYGGSIAGRVRLLREVAEAVAGIWGAARVGVRLSPTGPYNDMKDSNPEATFAAAASALAPLGLAWLHLVAPGAVDPTTLEHRIVRRLRRESGAPIILNGGLDRTAAEAAVGSGLTDLASFGVLYLANPDLVERFAEGSDLNTPDRATFYSGGARGYTDYPFRSQAA